MDVFISQLTVGQLVWPVVIFIVIIIALQFLLTLWIRSRIEKSIQYEYDKKLEDYRALNLQRDKAEFVANFLALWIKYRGQEKYVLTDSELFDYYQKLNEMSLQLSIWIRDKKLAHSMMRLLEVPDESEETIRTLIVKVRQHILNEKTPLDANKIAIWPTEEEMSEIIKRSHIRK